MSDLPLIRSWLWLGVIACGACLLLPLSGCRSEGVETYTYKGQPDAQRYDLEEVKQRVPQLHKGMTPTEVLLLLGSPTKREAGRWVYLPSRTGTIIPAEALEVRFFRGRYVEHVWQPIVGGERIITD